MQHEVKLLLRPLSRWSSAGARDGMDGWPGADAMARARSPVPTDAATDARHALDSKNLLLCLRDSVTGISNRRDDFL